MSKLLNKKIEQVTLRSGVKETKISISRKDTKFLIKPKDTKQIVKEVYEKVSKNNVNFKIFLRSFGPTHPFTFNIDDTGDIENFQEYEDYYEGTIRQEQKLVNAGMIQVFVQIYQ